MPSIPLYPPAQRTSPLSSTVLINPLPSLLRTPTGLALLEIQGTIHSSGISLSSDTGNDNDSHDHNHSDPHNTAGPDASTDNGVSNQAKSTQIGRLVFPDYVEGSTDDKKWMKRVYLYIGKHQRMGGEVRELRRPVGVVRRRQNSLASSMVESAKGKGKRMVGLDEIDGAEDSVEEKGRDGNEVYGDELEIAEIVRYKIVFANRPEPVGTEEVVARS